MTSQTFDAFILIFTKRSDLNSPTFESIMMMKHPQKFRFNKQASSDALLNIQALFEKNPGLLISPHPLNDDYA